MNTSTLNQLELNLATALAAETKRIGLFIGKAKQFSEAAISGLTSIPDGTAINVTQIVEKSFVCLTNIASITGNQSFIKLTLIASNLYLDCATGKVNIVEIFKAFEQAKAQLKQMNTGNNTTDANLTADELALANHLGQLAKMLALYFDDDRSAAFIDAINTGFADVSDAEVPTLKELVDGGFGILSIIAQLLNNNIIKLSVEAAQNLYDDFEGGKTGLVEVWAKVMEAKKSILASPKQIPAAPADKAKTEQAAAPADAKAELESLLEKVKVFFSALSPEEVEQKILNLIPEKNK